MRYIPPTWFLAVLISACSGSDDGVGRSGRAAPSQPPPGSAGAGAGTNTGTGDFANSANPTGSGPVGQTGSDPAADDPATGLGAGEECVGFDAQAKNGAQPADIIIAVDQSSSMTAETVFVQTQLNSLSQRIVDAMIDVHVILIVQKPPALENPVCVPPPLAGPNCADNEPLFKHVNQHVDSDDAWNQIIATYPQYRHLMRPGAQKHVVVITDDAPSLTRTSFDQMFKALDPQLEGYRHHAIYGFTYPGEAPFCLQGGTADPCCGFADGDGSEYGRLSDETGGIKGNLCLQDFEPVWSELVMLVVENATLACDWEIPPPPAGEMLDPRRVNVFYSGDGVMPQLISSMQDVGACGMNDGWYYDNNDQPTRVFACPRTCATIQGLANARIDIKFGCGICAGLDADCGSSPPPKPPSVD